MSSRQQALQKSRQARDRRSLAERRRAGRRNVAAKARADAGSPRRTRWTDR